MHCCNAIPTDFMLFTPIHQPLLCCILTETSQQTSVVRSDVLQFVVIEKVQPKKSKLGRIVFASEFRDRKSVV